MSLTTCRDCGKRFQIGPLLDLPQPTRCLECLIGLEAKLAAAETRAASLSQELLAARDGRDTNRAACVPLNEYAHERLKRLEEALRRIAEGICQRNWYTAGRSMSCLDISTVMPCASCIARRALAGGGK